MQPDRRSRTTVTRAIALIAVTLAALATLAGCSKKSDGTGVLDLDTKGPGTCIDAPDDLGETVKRLPTVPCTTPHTHELYSVVDYDEGDVFPGLEALDAFAQRVCLRDFEPYVGTSSFDSSLTFSWLTPTLGSWNNHDDRAILCVLTDFSGAPLTGSMKDAKV